MRRSLHLLIPLLLLGELLLAQEISTGSLYTLFLNYHASSVKGRTLADPANRAINEAALKFVEDQSSLAKEAKKYLEARGGKDDAAAQSFSDRREALAIAAIESLRGKLTTESYAALLQRIERFRGSIRRVR